MGFPPWLTAGPAPARSVVLVSFAASMQLGEIGSLCAEPRFYIREQHRERT
jgi:hypothetical protein